MDTRSFFSALSLFLTAGLFAQSTAEWQKIDGQILDKTSQSPVPTVSVSVFDEATKTYLAETATDARGRFSILVPHAPHSASSFLIQANKANWLDASARVDGQNPAFSSLEMRKKPGFIFDVTMFDRAFAHDPINTLTDCKVEIYNNTTRQEELVIERLPKATFNFTFAEGNHYTMLVRKPGYINRRVEVYVNIDGCLLCVDGMGTEQPDMVQMLTDGDELGHVLGALDLDSIQIGKRFRFDNIYYDYDRWAIRPDAARELDKMAGFLKDNPGIAVELGSHTDARGSEGYNQSLSEKRAASAVDYLIEKAGLDRELIASKGYGESQLVVPGTEISERDHQLNRRTELKITGIRDRDPLWDKSLRQIKEDPQLFEKIIREEKRRKAAGSSLSNRD